MPNRAQTEIIAANNLRLSVWDRVKEVCKPLVRRRRFHAYCVGIAKSGTHSLAEVFNGNYRAEHEPGAEELIWLKHESDRNTIGAEKIEEFLRKRDLRFYLEIESSGFVGYFLEQLCHLYPNAKFILTIRDCYSFLSSIINHQVNKPVTVGSIWGLGRDIDYQCDLKPLPEEEIITSQYPELYSVRGYLTYWATRNAEVLNVVPSSRLMVVKTEQIGEKLTEIARFLGIPADTLTADRSHSFKGDYNIDVLACLDREWLDAVVEETGCRAVMDDVFR